MEKKANSDIQQAILALLSQLGEDVNREGLAETPARFEKQIRECLVGYADNPVKYVKLFDNTNFHDLVSVNKIAFSSLCEHHLLPFYGYIDIGYVPNEKILGLSKFARIIDALSKRLQVQERLTQELADFLYAHLEPLMLTVHVKAFHTCMTIRGVQRPEALTETRASLGETDTYAHYIHTIGT